MFAGDNLFRIELYIDQGDKMANKHAYGQIERRREDVEAELGAKVHWERLDRQASRVSWHWDQSVTVLDPANKLENSRHGRWIAISNSEMPSPKS